MKIPGLYDKKSVTVHSAKQGKRIDLDNIYFRSAWEANMARYFKFLKDKGMIYNWEFEADTFYFDKVRHGSRTYLPDFKIWETANSTPYYIEVKGYMTSVCRTKLKRMQKYYPHIRVDLVQKKEYDEIKAKMSAMLPHWE